jgi:hypothetical protein
VRMGRKNDQLSGGVIRDRVVDDMHELQGESIYEARMINGKLGITFPMIDMEKFRSAV